MICVLIYNTVVTRAECWRHLALDKVLITVKTITAENECSKELTVGGSEILKHCRLDQAEWYGNSRHLFTVSLYSPLGEEAS